LWSLVCGDGGGRSDEGLCYVGSGCGAVSWVESRREGGFGDVRVDDADHAALAVRGLRAVVPDGIGVVDR